MSEDIQTMDNMLDKKENMERIESLWLALRMK
jgi:hypothetical protein